MEPEASLEAERVSFFVDFVIRIYASRTCIDVYAKAYIAKPVHRLFIYNTSIMSLYYSISTYDIE